MCRRTAWSALRTWANRMTGVGDRRHVRAGTVILIGRTATVGLKTVAAEWNDAFDVRASRDRLSAGVGPTMILNTIAASGFGRRRRGEREHRERQNIRDQGNLSHLKFLPSIVTPGRNRVCESRGRIRLTRKYGERAAEYVRGVTLVLGRRSSA